MIFIINKFKYIKPLTTLKKLNFNISSRNQYVECVQLMIKITCKNINIQFDD